MTLTCSEHLISVGVLCSSKLQIHYKQAEHRFKTIVASRSFSMTKRDEKKVKKDKNVKHDKKNMRRQQQGHHQQQPLMFPMMMPSALAPPQSKSDSDSPKSSSSQTDSDDEEISHKGATTLSKIPKKRLCALVTYLSSDIDNVTAAEASVETLLRAAWCFTRSKPVTPLSIFRAKKWKQLWKQFAIRAKSIEKQLGETQYKKMADEVSLLHSDTVEEVSNQCGFDM